MCYQFIGRLITAIHVPSKNPRMNLIKHNKISFDLRE